MDSLLRVSLYSNHSKDFGEKNRAFSSQKTIKLWTTSSSLRNYKLNHVHAFPRLILSVFIHRILDIFIFKQPLFLRYLTNSKYLNNPFSLDWLMLPQGQYIRTALVGTGSLILIYQQTRKKGKILVNYSGNQKVVEFFFFNASKELNLCHKLWFCISLQPNVVNI